MKKFFQCCLLVIGLFVAGFAWSGEKEEVYQDWGLHCTEKDKSACVLEQRVYVEGAGKTPLVHMAFQRLEVGKDGGATQGLWGVLRVPLGVKLAPGLQFRIDEGVPKNVPLHHCQAAGCIALFPLDSALRRRLETGRRAWVTFETLNGQKVGVPISLSGIKPGLKALEKSAAKKRGM